MSVINFEALCPEAIILDLKYPQGYLYWDKCGKIIKEITNNWKNIGKATISIQNVNITFPEKSINLNFSSESINIVLVNSKDVNFLGEFADSVVNTICNHLEIDIFSRIGNRFQFIKPFESADDFIKIFGAKGILQIPEDIISIIGNKIEKQKIEFTIYKDEDFGYCFSFAQFKRKLEAYTPPQVSIDDSKFITKGILFDLDIFTIKPISLSILKCSELLKKNRKEYESLIKMLL
jgi:hypothetical protein